MNVRRVGAGLGTVAIVAAILYFAPTNEAESTIGERRTGRATISTIKESISATGAIRPTIGAEVVVGSRISGTVINLAVQIGDRVEEGELLAELDDSALRAAAEQATADVVLAEPRVALARSTLTRRETLATTGVISIEDVELARRDLRVEEAQLAASEARLKSAEIALGYTRIWAPISGVVAEVSTREGETVAAAFAAPNFVTIVDLERLEVLAYVDETDIGRVAIGQQATFSVDTYPDVYFPAHVAAIQPRAEIQGNVVNYVVRLAMDLPEGYTLRPEMTAHVRVLVDERQDVLTVPRNTLRRRNGKQFVIVSRDGAWVEQDVTTGWRSEGRVEILSGLGADEILEVYEPD